jgi:hypothetical protein
LGSCGGGLASDCFDLSLPCRFLSEIYGGLMLICSGYFVFLQWVIGGSGDGLGGDL